ncbi:DUF262 domain-containing HNH endonuclease family protein [Methanothermococcus sp.]|uniref:DUF262 domain-containing protein n=1 Tax=Methanothermococcus sp. TaxID=2614238 RepID=UPI0025E6B921|nr:DUF262 domain-containing HNH endonuclease family protein [Methanothermococcus sp.]
MRIETNEVNINRLFSNDFWFVIPEYQRPYLWKEDNVNDLLDDLWFAYKEYGEYHGYDEDKYFLGSLVLYKRSEENNGIRYIVYDIVDGQQRLTTLMLLMAVLRDITNNEMAKRQLNELIYQEENEFGNIPERIKIKYIIRDDVEEFIKSCVVLDNETINVNNRMNGSTEENNISISNMKNAISTMHDFFKDDEKQQKIDRFIRFLLNNIVFVYISTENLTDAFRLFSVLNNRGIPLTNADILKAENIGKIDNENEREEYAKIWEDLENYFELIGENYFDRFLSFIRTIFLKEKARKTLYEEFKKIYDKKMLERGEETIDLLKKYKEIYNKLIELNNFEIENGYKNLITIMKIGIKSDEWIPPLLYFWYRFRIEKREDETKLKSNLVKFLKKLEYKFSSDWIIGYTPTQRIENMNKILKRIAESNSSDEVINNNEIFKVDAEKLKEVLHDDDIYKKRYAKFVLLKYAYLRMENDMVHLSNIKNISIEHILPQKPKENSQWVRDFSKEEREYWTDKLANLVLISGKKNSSLKNYNFREKIEKLRELQRKRGFGIFDFMYEEVIGYNEWTPNNLKNRQDKMVNKLICNQ